jgi:succinyl-CoA synthetase beta subunit
LDLMEYKAKELYNVFEIPTTKGAVIDSVEELPDKVKELKFPLVAKAQVQTGGRGKAGGIKFAQNMDELVSVSKSIIGMDIKGHTVRKLLISEKAEVQKEFYLSIILDRTLKVPVIIFSSEGGVDIEETAKNSPEKIVKVPVNPLTGVKDYAARYILSKSGLDLGLFDSLFDLIYKLYKMFMECDCTLAEINPLCLLADGTLSALDGKVSIDDSALFKYPDILEFRDSIEENELILEARKYRFLYIPCEQDGEIAVMSNGSGMLMSCIDMITKNGMTVGAVLDLGGGATADRIKEAIRILFMNKKIKALFINIFGGITRCDEVASGVKLAMEMYVPDKTLIVRFEGTNKQKGLEVLASITGDVAFVDGLSEGVRVLGERMGKL